MIDLELKNKIDEELHDLHNSEQLRTKAADDSGFSFTPIEDGEEPDVDLKVAPEGFSFTPVEDDFDPWKIKPQHKEKNDEGKKLLNAPVGDVKDEYRETSEALEYELRRIRNINSD